MSNNKWKSLYNILKKKYSNNELENLKTSNFKINYSKTKNIKGLYFNTTSKDKLEIYQSVFQKAIDITNNEIEKLYNPYNTRHYCNYFSEKIQKELNIIWSNEIRFEEQQNNQFKVYLLGNSGINGKYIDFNRYLLHLIKKSNYKKNWYILPIAIVGHSISINLYKNKKNNTFEMYLCDPNGPIDINNLKTELDTTINNFIIYLKNFCNNNNNIEYKGYLLKDLKPQGGSTLFYIDTDGFCGAFTWLIIFIIILNDNITPENLYEYIHFRYHQWNNTHAIPEKIVSGKNEITMNNILLKFENIKDLIFLQNILIDIRFFNRTVVDKKILRLSSTNKSTDDLKEKYTILEFYNYFISNISEEEKLSINIDNLSEDYETFIKQIKYSLNKEQLSEFRKKTVQFTKDLNWFENHILMFLMYIREYYDEYFETQVTDFSNNNIESQDFKIIL